MANQRIVRGFDLHEKLKEHKPAQVIAFTEDDEQVKVNVPDVRQKHARVITALKDIPWILVDLLDKKGGLLHRHKRCVDDSDAPAGEIEDIRTSRTNAELSGLLQIMLKAQEVVLIRHTQSMQQAFDAQNRLMESTLRRLDQQEQQLAQAMQMNHALSGDLVNAQLQQLQLVAPGTDDEGNPKPVSNSDRALAAFLPAFLRAAAGEKPDKPKNGANGKSDAATEQTAKP